MTDIADLVARSAQPVAVDMRTVDGVFIKQYAFPKAGSIVPQHAHVWSHATVLARGEIMVWRAGRYVGRFTAPALIEIPARVAHTFRTVVPDTTILCVHNIMHGDDKIAVLEEHELTADDLALTRD
jgi:hypothetical protein